MRKAYAVVHHAQVSVVIHEPWDNGGTDFALLSDVSALMWG